MQRITNITLKLDDEPNLIKTIVAKQMNINLNEIKTFKIVKKSVDARDKSDIKLIYTVDVSKEVEKPIRKEYPKLSTNNRPVVVGFGPAGIFAGLVLAKAGLCPIIMEQGDAVESRQIKVDTFWKTGKLDKQSNVQFGEGGAGAFSDGKLNTLINNPLCDEVLTSFYEAGAPEEILYENKPHIGTDRLIPVIRNLREQIIALGGEVKFNTKLVDISVENGNITGVTADKFYATDRVILATGHSGREVYQMLSNRQIQLSPKAFSVGVRIEHPQNMIDRNQYGKYAGHKNLPHAEYKLVYHNATRSAYTFCMCPGGIVVASSSEEGGIVTNGMSNFLRDGKNANSALLVGINPADYGGTPLGGIKFQEQLEQAAFIAGGSAYKAPCQMVGDFMKGTLSKSFGSIEPTYSNGVVPSRLDSFLPTYVTQTLKSAISDMSRRLSAFSTADAPLTGIETRTSSPLRVDRNEQFMSVSLKGLYPCGEGCGYAGGIMSAAVDGIKVAQAILNEITG